MSEININLTAYYDDQNILALIQKGLSLAYENNKTASDTCFKDAAIKVWPEGHDNWDMTEFQQDDGCIRFSINSGTIGFDVDEFVYNLSGSGAKFLLADIFNDQVGERSSIAFKENKKVKPATIIKELAKIDPTVALGISIDKGRVKDSISLIAQGANPNGRMSGIPFIVLAARNESFSIVKALLDAGADPQAKSPINLEDLQEEMLSHYSALHWSAYNDSYKITKLLLESGADVNSKNYMGRTPIYEAFVAYADLKTIALLIDVEIDLENRDKDGMTPLLDMLDKYYIDDTTSKLKLLNMLIENNADPHAVNKYGGNALWYSAFDKKIVQRLNALGVKDLIAPEGVYSGSSVRNLITAITHDDQPYIFSHTNEFKALNNNDKALLLGTSAVYNRIDIAKWLLDEGISPATAYCETPSSKPITAHQVAKDYRHQELYQLFDTLAKEEIKSQDAFINQVRPVFENFIQALIKFNQGESNINAVTGFYDSQFLSRFEGDEEAIQRYIKHISFNAVRESDSNIFENNYNGTVNCRKLNKSNGDLIVTIKRIDGKLKISNDC